MADSRKVAEVFEKEHKHVLRDIRGILERWPDRGGSNFGLVAYFDEKGEERPCYEMTRDGFAFLALGWKTERAEGFKWSFMDAFNAMETELRRRLEEDRIKALAEAKAELAGTQQLLKKSEEQRVGAQRSATSVREMMDKQANELKELRASVSTPSHL